MCIAGYSGYNKYRISTVSLSTGTITATGNITTLGVSSRVTFTGAGLISVNGTFMSGTAGTLTAATGTVRYNASGNQTIGNYSYYNLTLAGSGTKTESSATVNGTLCMEGTATISGTITYGANATLKYNTSTSRSAGAEWFATFVASGGIIIDNTGTITLNAAKVVNSPLVIASGSTLASGNYNLTLSKDITNDGTFIPGSATVTFNGSSNQNLAGESAILFNNLTINNTAGITFSGTANEIVNGTLTLSNGIISTGSNVLQMGNSAIISGAGSTKYINGNLEKGISANTVSIQFEVGDSQDYAPLTITFSGNTNSAGTITASTNPTDHPAVNSSNIDPTLSLNRYWTLENNNVTGYTSYDAVFTYNASELDGGADYNDFIAGMYSSTSWTYPLIDNMTSSTLEVIELTEFGDYQFGESAVSPIACGYDDNGSTPYVADIIPCINIASNPITISSTFSSHQYFTLNVIKGITYEVYTCNSTSPNNQITLSVYREGNAADPSIAFSYSNTGNPCTSSANNAYVTFTPEFSGMVRVLINRKYFCTSTQLSGLIVMLNVKGGSNTLDDQSEAGNEDWIGHLYEGTNSGVAYTGNFSNYLGYYAQTETFNETFGGGTNDVDCFAPILSEGTERGSLKTITYSIRYRMNSSRRGLYTVDLGSDDGSRLAIDGALAYNNWSDQAYSSRPRVLISLTGNSSLVYDFNENAGASRVTFQNLSLVLENILSTNNNQNICLGNSGSAISGDVYGSLPVGVSLSGTGYQWTYSTEPYGTRITISGATASTYTPNSGSSPFNTAGTYYLYRNATLSSTNNVSPNPYVATNESNAAVITVSALPVATFSYTGSPYCKSASDPTPTFSGGGIAGTFSSTAGLVFVNTSTGQIDLSASTAGTYTVTNTIASSGGCSAVISTSTITINPVLTAGISIAASSTNICSGTVVSFTATPSNGGSSPSYQWKVNGVNVGSNSSGYSSGSIVNNDVVSCVITSNASCITGSPATSNLLTITVNPNLPASVSIAASATTICAGTNVTFTATPANGGSSPTYQWKVNGSNVGTNSSTYSNSSLANGNTVTCVMTSNATCATGSPSTSNTVTMTVNPNLPVSVSVSASATTICSGTNVTFTATPTNGGSSPSYQWKLNGSNVGTNSTTYSNSSLTNGNTITCQLTSNATCATGSPATSNTVTMVVNPNLPVSISIAGSATTICSGTNVTFTATPVNGGSTPSYQWKLNGSNVGTSSSTYTNSSLVNNDVVTCILTSNATCATSSPATSNAVTMTVNPNLPVSISVSASSTTICSGTNVTFTATPTNGGSSPSYQWKLNGSNVGTNSTTYSNSALANGNTISCVITSNATCATGSPATSNTVTMTVNPVLPASVAISASSNPVCSGTSVTFTATPTNGGSTPTYQWKLNGNNVGTNSTTYSNSALVNSDIVSCVLTSNATCVSGSPATSNSVTMTVNPNLPVSVTVSASATTICSGTNVTYTATAVNGGAAPTYQWKLNGSVVGTNSATYSNASLVNGDQVKCELTSNATCATGSPASSNLVTMTVNPNLPASVTISASSTNICSGTSVTFTAVPINGGASPVYQWKLNGNNTGSNSSTYTSSSLVNNDIVSCIMTSNATCATGSPATSNAVSITVNPILPASVSVSASSSTICSGTSVTFTATPVNGGAAPVYSWKVNGSTVGTNSSTFTSSSLVNNDVVSCIMTSNAVCVSGSPATSNLVTMTVNPNLPVSISIAASATTICPGTSVTFTATPTNGGSSPGYQWKLNGSNVGTNTSTYVNASLANNDQVSCVLTSNATCATGNPASSNSVTMTVNPNLSVSISISASANYHLFRNQCHIHCSPNKWGIFTFLPMEIEWD
ncbi:MAG: hypothetical protein IPH45_03125 [Bacteroidales bacterium]|nr:hypothetical protein [Bacteroidales bacterium]